MPYYEKSECIVTHYVKHRASSNSMIGAAQDRLLVRGAQYKEQLEEEAGSFSWQGPSVSQRAWVVRRGFTGT